MKEHVQISAIPEDDAYLGLGNWGEFPCIVYQETLMVTTLSQEKNTIRFTESQLKVLHEMLKRRFEDET